MPKSVFTDEYAALLATLVSARKAAGLTQAELSARLGRPQPFVSYVERGERRVYVVEFYAIALALGLDPVGLFAEAVSQFPNLEPPMV
jgi:transcriptional regulator with XRE-family HTH domain